MSGQPPAYVQKAWDARYSYDADRRLLVPEYAGSRWGAVQQYKEEGELVYQTGGSGMSALRTWKLHQTLRLHPFLMMMEM